MRSRLAWHPSRLLVTSCEFSLASHHAQAQTSGPDMPTAHKRDRRGMPRAPGRGPLGLGREPLGAGRQRAASGGPSSPGNRDSIAARRTVAAENRKQISPEPDPAYDNANAENISGQSDIYAAFRYFPRSALRHPRSSGVRDEERREVQAFMVSAVSPVRRASGGRSISSLRCSSRRRPSAVATACR